MNVVILHSNISKQASQDEEDTLIQAEAISSALKELGYDVVLVPFSLHLEKVIKAINKIKPAFVFNLVESVNSSGELIYLAPALLDFMKIPYTGAPTEAIFLSTSKLNAKNIFGLADIPTSKWVLLEDLMDEGFVFDGPYIIKSVWEHGSAGISTDSVFFDKESLLQEMSRRCKNGLWFAEKYIDGREINFPFLGNNDDPALLPFSEIRFEGFFDGKIKLLDYKAKWNKESDEYQNSVQYFDFLPEDQALLNNLKEIAKKCWKQFKMRGYGRVDFRIDKEGNPFVLEVNANCCISPDSGFIMATEQAQMTYTQVIEKIIEVTGAH